MTMKTITTTNRKNSEAAAGMLGEAIDEEAGLPKTDENTGEHQDEKIDELLDQIAQGFQADDASNVETNTVAVDPQIRTGLIPLAATDPGLSVPTDDLPMTDAEVLRLGELESGIKESWWALGRACKEIKESKLYRITRDGKKQTWEEYCQRVHDQTRQYLDRVIRATQVIVILETETKVSVFPETVSQAAPLSGLKPQEMAKATEAAFKAATSQKRNVTADDFKKAADKLKPPKKSKGKTKPRLSARPETAGQPAAETKMVETKSDDEPTRSVGLHINTVSLVAPVREFFQEFGLKPKISQTGKGTVFIFDGSATDQQNLLEALASLLSAKGPMDMEIMLE